MRLSDWQLNRLRDALGAYHDYERGIEGDYFNWKDVSAAIEELTGVSIPQERLRQFVEGVKLRTADANFPCRRMRGSTPSSNSLRTRTAR